MSKWILENDFIKSNFLICHNFIIFGCIGKLMMKRALLVVEFQHFSSIYFKSGIFIRIFISVLISSYDFFIFSRITIYGPRICIVCPISVFMTSTNRLCLFWKKYTLVLREGWKFHHLWQFFRDEFLPIFLKKLEVHVQVQDFSQFLFWKSDKL